MPRWNYHVIGLEHSLDISDRSIFVPRGSDRKEVWVCSVSVFVCKPQGSVCAYLE
jgi:hypothetical protein